MKKTLVILSITLSVIVIAAMTLTPAKGTGHKGQISSGSSSIPDSLYKVFQTSCFHCHTDSGKVMAKSMVNFSSWDKYEQKDKVKKGNLICKQISEGNMPPKSAIKSRPGIALTDAQVKSICKWVTSLGKE